MNIIMGNLVTLAEEGEFGVIAHGCNCFKNMGAGIAKTIASRFPDALEADLAFETPKLGKMSLGYDQRYNLVIANCYTQHWFGSPYETSQRNKYKQDTYQARYDAIGACMETLNKKFSDDSIGIPLIGCGLAGLDWGTVGEIIEDKLVDVDFTIVVFNEKDRLQNNITLT